MSGNRRKEQNLDFKEHYFNVWQQVWNLHKKYFGIQQQDDTKWEKFHKDCEMLSKSYSDKPEQEFINNLLCVVMVELERSDKRNAETPKTPETQS